MLESLEQVGTPPWEYVESVTLGRNFAWTLAGNILYAACQWGILISIAKLGTPAMVGQFALGLAVSAPVFMLTSLQLRAVLATDARDEYHVAHYFALRILGTAAGLILIAGFVALSHFRRDTAMVILLVSLAKAAETLSDIVYGFWQKHEHFDKIAIALSGRGLGTFAAVAVVLYFTRSIVLATTAMAAYWFVWLATYERNGAKNLLAGVSSHESLQADWNREECKRLAVLSMPLGIVMLLLSLNANFPRYFVEHYLGEAALGYFAAMAYVFVAGNTLMAAMGQSSLPRLARQFDSNRPAFVRLLKNMVSLGAAVGFAGVGLGVFFGPAFLRLVYRADYAQYANVFIWLMVGAAFAFVGSMLGYAMTAARVFRPQVPLFLGTTAVTALACWITIPRWGLTGSAYAVLFGAVFSCTGSAYVVSNFLRSQPRGRDA
jgi:O-antigen/teichoic acid export membrane protein